MKKNSRRMACFWLAYSCFVGNFLEETPRNQPIDLPTKGVKGMSNAELKPHKSGKNKRKRREK